MHNFYVTGNASISMLNTNMNLLEKACDGGFYKVWSSSDDLNDGGAAAAPTRVAGVLNQLPPSWSLQNAATTRVCGYVPRFVGWENGAFSMTVHFGTGVIGGDIAFRYTVQPIKADVATNATALQAVVPAPAATGTISTVTFHTAELNTMSAINRSHIGVMFSIGRSGADASDTCTGAIRIYGVELTYHEIKRATGGKA